MELQDQNEKLKSRLVITLQKHLPARIKEDLDTMESQLSQQ